MDDIKKLEKVEAFSLSKLRGSIDFVLSRVDANEMLTNQLQNFDAAYPLLDLKKSKEMLEEALKQ